MAQIINRCIYVHFIIFKCVYLYTFFLTSFLLALFACTPVAARQSEPGAADSLWAYEQLDDDTLEDLPSDTPRSTSARKLRVGYSMLAQPAPRSARLHLDLSWEPASWIRMKTTSVRRRNEALLFQPSRFGLGAAHTMAFVDLHRGRAQLVLGDFRIRSASSISDFTPRTPSRSRSRPARSLIGHADMRPYAGASRSTAPRGVAAGMTLATGLSLMAFASRKETEGRVQDDTPVLAARGVALQATRSDVRASVSWIRFGMGQTRLEWFESAFSMNLDALPLKAGAAVAVRDARRWHVRTAEITWTFPESRITFWYLHLPYWDISPWGAGNRFSDRDTHTRVRGIAIEGPTRSSVHLTSGFSRRFIRRRDTGKAPLSRSEGHFRIDTPRIAAEWRLLVDDEDDVTPGFPRIRLRTVESVVRHRATFTLRSPDSARWTWSIRGVASASHALSAQIRRAGTRRALVVTRAVTWGHSPDAWAVVYTDRMPGHMGLLRANRPRTVQMVRLEGQTRWAHDWSLAVSVETDMDTGMNTIMWALAWNR